MALKSIYEDFLDSPSSQHLSNDASLNYITSLVTFSQPLSIIRHLENQDRNVVKKRKTSVLSTVEGQSSLAVELSTTLEFLSGGGAFLPGVDNMVAGKSATIPLTHIVHFDRNNKISRIRISWDQATLLKQVDIIGRTGKNWPISDGVEQIKLIQNNSVAPKTSTPTKISSYDDDLAQQSPSKRLAKEQTNRLFEPAADEDPQTRADPNPVEPRQSAKPPPRDMSDLFVAGHEDYEPSAANGGSPKKIIEDSIVSPKAGVKHFQPVRLFEDDIDLKPMGYKTNPARYNHFDLGDSYDDPMQFKVKPSRQQENIPLRGHMQRPQSQWGFEDSDTPAKPQSKPRTQDMRSLGWNDDETPDKAMVAGRALPGKARKDAEKHFAFDDQNTPATKRVGPAPKKSSSRGAGLYVNNLYGQDDDEEQAAKFETDGQREKAPLSTINNNIGRKNEISSHWSLTNSSPMAPKPNQENKHMADDRKKAVQMMNSHWESQDQSPEPTQKTAVKTQSRQGMQSHWAMEDDEEEQEAVIPTRKIAQRQTDRGFWDF